MRRSATCARSAAVETQVPKPSYVYCPQCGAPLTERVKFGQVRRACRYCGFIHFADPKVAVAALVTDGPRVLLVRRLAVPQIRVLGAARRLYGCG